VFTLTKRQYDIVTRVARGCTDQQIADELGISPRTVSNSLARIYDRVGVSGRVHLAVLHATGKIAVKSEP
jgi:DNA-binding CsgD family transcriptional regulator